MVTIFAEATRSTITAALKPAQAAAIEWIHRRQVKAFGADYAFAERHRDRAGSPRIVILNVPNMVGCRI
jgi:G:T-mismatch repair DNA endonuclease (very short patch repair protein)